MRSRGGLGSDRLRGLRRPVWSGPVRVRRPGAAMAVKVAHSVVTFVLSGAGVYVLVCGVSGRRGPWLGVCIVALGVELLAYVGNGLRCPMTTLARALGDETGHDWLFERLMPEPWLRFIAPTFGGLAAVGLVSIAIAALAR